VKFALFIFNFIPLLFPYASKPVVSVSSSKVTQIIQPLPVQQWQTVEAAYEDAIPKSLNTAVYMGVEYLAGRIPSGANVAVLSVQSPTENLSNYIIDTAVMHLINADRFMVIERSELGVIQNELAYQLSGEVSDETAVSIGSQLGVQVIITGAIMETGDRYSLRLKALDVETARILGMRMYQVPVDAALAALLKPPPRKQKPQGFPQGAVINGDVNITNNSNTTIHGDVYVNKPEGFDADEWF
jgi:TolB-like protein